jgi:hypothetical protein
MLLLRWCSCFWFFRSRTMVWSSMSRSCMLWCDAVQCGGRGGCGGRGAMVVVRAVGEMGAG